MKTGSKTMKAAICGVAATMLLGLGALVPASAGDAGGEAAARSSSDKVTVQQLPRVKEIARVMPELAGAVRYLDRETVLAVPGKTCRDEVAVKAASGRAAMYLAEDFAEQETLGLMAYLQVFRMTSVKDAAASTRAFQRFVARCAGPRIEGSRLTRLTLPKLGQQRVGLRVVDRDGYASAFTIVRRGRTLIISMVGDSKQVKKADAVAVTRLALRTSKR